MSTNFPTSLDSLTNPTSADDLDTAGVLHDVQHADANDAIEALEAKVGINSSAVTTSHDYRLGLLYPTHGPSMHTDATRTIWVDASQSYPAPALTGTAPAAYPFVAMNNSAGTTYVSKMLAVPEDWTSASAMSVIIYYTPTAAGSGDVRWLVNYRHAPADGSASLTTAGTDTDFTEAIGATSGRLYATASASLGTPAAARDGLRLSVGRAASDAADTSTNDIRYIGALVLYTATG